MSLPSKKQTIKMLKKIEEDINKGKQHVTMLPHPDASICEKMKFRICEDVLLVKMKYELTNAQIGEIIHTDEKNVSRIINYHIDKFTLDKLMIYYELLIESTEDKKAIKAFNDKIKGFLKAN